MVGPQKGTRLSAWKWGLWGKTKDCFTMQKGQWLLSIFQVFHFVKKIFLVLLSMFFYFVLGFAIPHKPCFLHSVPVLHMTAIYEYGLWRSVQIQHYFCLKPTILIFSAILSSILRSARFWLAVIWHIAFPSWPGGNFWGMLVMRDVLFNFWVWIIASFAPTHQFDKYPLEKLS